MSRFAITLDTPRTWWKCPAYELAPHLVGDWGHPRQEGWEIYAEPARWAVYELPESGVLPEILAVDSADEQDVLRFVRRFGVMGVEAAEISQGEMQIGLAAVYVSEIQGTGTVYAWRGASAYELLTDFAAGADMLRRGQEIAAELAAPGGFNSHTVTPITVDGEQWEPPQNQKVARFQFRRITNTGLSAFKIRAFEKEGHMAFLGDPPLSLFALACLELADAAAKGLPWRLCTLDTCKRLFQPSRHDQIYHGSICSRAAASRAYRRRERQRKDA